MQRLPLASSHILKQIHSQSLICSRVPSVFRRNLLPLSQSKAYIVVTRKYATMSTQSTQSHACCTVPPVVDDNYKEKGSYETIEGMKTYVTGDKNAKSALLVVYDIFGFFPQTLQGADILATGDKEKPKQVFMPGRCYCRSASRQGS